MNVQVRRVAEVAFALENLDFLSHIESPAPRISRSRTNRMPVPVESDVTYFSRRAREEKAYASEAADELSRSLHLELAERYSGLAAAIREAEEKIG